MKRRWQNPELRDRMIKGLSGHPSSLKGKKLSPEFCEKIRQARLKQWQSPEYRAKMIAAFLGMRSPNNMELQLLGILNKYHPGEWEFVGNGKVILCGLNPDFINVNGKKQIIEFFGAYWHKPGTASYRIHRSEEYRISEFAKLGFRTLVIWHKELKDEVALVSRINRFTTGAGHEGKVGTYIN